MNRAENKDIENDKNVTIFGHKNVTVFQECFNC